MQIGNPAKVATETDAAVEEYLLEDDLIESTGYQETSAWKSNDDNDNNNNRSVKHSKAFSSALIQTFRTAAENQRHKNTSQVTSSRQISLQDSGVEYSVHTYTDCSDRLRSNAVSRLRSSCKISRKMRLAGTSGSDCSTCWEALCTCDKL